MTAKIDGTNGLLQQYDYQVSTTGFSYTFAAGTTNLVMNPAGTLATGTITMPSAPADGMTITFSSSQIITALTVNANTGQSIVGQPTSLTAGGAATFVYRLSNTTWYTQLNTNISGSSAPVLNVYATPGTWTKPATVKAIKVTVIGQGGNGGSATGGNGAGGGGGGGWSTKVYPASSLPAPQPYTAGPGTNSFGVAPVTVISATAGSAGSGGGPTTTGLIAAGGSGAGSGGTLVGRGWVGYIGSNGPIGTTYGAGGGSIAGGYPGYGSGGPGGPSGGGAAGSAGAVIIEEFY